MKVWKLKYLPGTKILTWRTVEDNSGEYYTFANGSGMHFRADDFSSHFKVATIEKFKICKTLSGTRKKLNRMFADKTHDPTEEDPWRF